MHLPDCLPDELLYSRLIRHVTIKGEEGHIFVRGIFGSSRISVHPFLTSNIEVLGNFFNENSETLLFQQTLAPIFMFYLPKHAEKIAKFLLEGWANRALRESQLASFGCGHSLLLKYCPLCVFHDLDCYGVAYWHRAHQVPGLTSCSIHPVHLKILKLNMRQRIVTGLLPFFEPKFTPASEVEFQVAKFSSELLLKLGSDFRCIDISKLYREHLAMRGFITRNGSIRRIEVMKQFSFFISGYDSNEEKLLPRNSLDYRYFSQLLESNGSHHPFRHLLFSYWLFRESEKLFIMTHISVEKKFSTNVSEMTLNIEQKCLQLLEDKRSLNEIYKITGKSRCYLKRLGLLNNIAMNLSPKNMTNECHKRIIEMAYSGFHLIKISEICNVGIGLVEQIISSQPGLVLHRKKCHFESKRRRYRVEIIRFIRKYPNALQRDIRIHCNKHFFWIYNNDHDWMISMLPKPSKPRGRYAD